MFNYINGKVAELEPSLAVIECSGIGFEVNTSAYTVAQLQKGENARLYTYMYIREDCMDLYGFATKSEKHCFELLIGVSGVGPKAAIAILSVDAPERLIMNIISGNEKALTAAPGIGKKIAQRIILELKDKLAKETGELSFADTPAFSPAPVGGDTRLSDATAALMVLGYGSAEVNAALKKIDARDMTTEQLVRAALRQMMK